jgi:opacity protein-like surface antigen
MLRSLALLVLFLFPCFAQGQSLWIETGFGYVEQLPSEGRAQQVYDSGFKVGARVVFPVSDRAGIYVSPYLLRGFNVDAGAWFTLPLNIQDVEGFTSYLGTGLTITNARFGFALSGALSYDLSNDVALTLVYTHRPLLTPKLSQAFDLAVGLRFELN